MNDNAKNWVKALRSGEYTQGRSVLTRVHSDGSEAHCCLGVACVLAVEAGVISASAKRAERNLVCYGDDFKTAVLPEAVRSWLGLTLNDSTFIRDGREDQLTALNDAGVSFEDIAKIIESEPEGLFE